MKWYFQIRTAIFVPGIFLCLGGCAVPQTSLKPSPANDTLAIRHLHLPRPIHFIKQSGDGACWLACAAMVYNYYGVPFSERKMDVMVKRLTLDSRGGQKAGDLRNCLVALAQMPGMTELLRARNPGEITDLSDSLGGFLAVLESNGAIKDPLSIVRCLNDADPPVIICKVDDPRSSEEHAMIVVGAELGIAPGSQPIIMIRSVDILDPSSPDGQLERRSAEYLSTHLQAVLSRTLAQQILTGELQNNNNIHWNAGATGPYRRTSQPSYYPSK